MSTANCIQMANVGIKGAFDIANASIVFNSKMSQLDNQAKLAKKHYQHMAEIISSREEGSNQEKDVKLAVMGNLEKLAEAEKSHNLAKARYTQARITKKKLTMKTGKLRALMSDHHYGNPV